MSPRGDCRRLEEEVSELRDFVVERVAEPYRGYLSDYFRYENYREWYGALLSGVLKEVDEAHPTAGRVACPLCGTTPQDAFQAQEGFTMPEGMRRHLDGWGPRRACLVMEVAKAQARGYFRKG